MPRLLRSNVCNQSQLQSDVFQRWCEKLGGHRNQLHRKVWEFCYIAQALYERGMLAPGRRGIGFGVGREPLVALLASFGCEIVATDLDLERARQVGWVESNEHAGDLDLLEALNGRGICDPDLFRRNVSYRSVDMTDIPEDLRDFDFTWSACSLEHLGSIEHGKRFVYDTVNRLKPGGVAVHTTEYNVLSNVNTLDNNGTVLFRRCDIEDIAGHLIRENHKIDLDFTLGTGIADDFVDVPPYSHDNVHLKLSYLSFVTTSIGLIVEKDRAGLAARTLQRTHFRLAQWLSAMAELRKGA